MTLTKKTDRLTVFSLDRLTCVSSSRCRIQSTSNCPTTAFLDSPSMRGRWGWKAHRVTRLLRSDQASCMMRKYGPPLLNLQYVTCVWRFFMNLVSYSGGALSGWLCHFAGAYKTHVITLKGSDVLKLGRRMYSLLILSDNSSLHCVVTLWLPWLKFGREH